MLGRSSLASIMECYMQCSEFHTRKESALFTLGLQLLYFLFVFLFPSIIPDNYIMSELRLYIPLSSLVLPVSTHPYCTHRYTCTIGWNHVFPFVWLFAKTNIDCCRIKPAVLRQATYGTIKFGIYYSLKQMLVQNQGEEHLGVNIFCAVTAGKLIDWAILSPTFLLQKWCLGRVNQSMLEIFPLCSHYYLCHTLADRCGVQFNCQPN